MSRLCDDALALRHGAPPKKQLRGCHMQTFHRLAPIVMAASVVMTGGVRAEVSCHKINARGVGQDLGDGATEAQLEGATGSLSIDGTQDLATGAFEEDIAGEICVDLSPLK
jgi:hypothetical protein